MKRTSVLNTGDTTMHFTVKPVQHRNYFIRAWVKQSSAQTGHVELLEMLNIVKIWADSNSNSFIIEWESDTFSMTPDTGSIVGSWRKISVSNKEANYERVALIDEKRSYTGLFSDSSKTISDLYLFGLKTASANPKFHGYIRELAAGRLTSDELPADSENPSLYAHYDYYYSYGVYNEFYLRMDEQYGKLFYNYASMLAVPMPASIDFASDSDQLTICTTRYFYNSDTGTCDRNTFTLLFLISISIYISFLSLSILISIYIN